jgi:hypothetical protein
VNPYAFFVGCPRSGTTLLGRIGDAHPQLAVIHETRWIPDWWENRSGLTPEGRVTPELVERLSAHPRFATLGIDRETLARLVGSRGPVPYAQLVTALFDCYGERHGKPFVGDKSPGYVRFVPTLHRLWPEARFVHMIRDGRDVCLSVLDWRKGVTRFSTFEQDPFTTAGVWWEWYVRLGREGATVLRPGLYHELRYESLVAEPEHETARLCDFLAIPYDSAMLRFHEGRTRSKPGLSTKSSWLPVTGGLRDWRRQMDRDDALRFEAAAGDLLDELGYERSARFVPRQEFDRAARIREIFAGEVQARQRPLPRAWSLVSA